MQAPPGQPRVPVALQDFWAGAAHPELNHPPACAAGGTGNQACGKAPEVNNPAQLSLDSPSSERLFGRV